MSAETPLEAAVQDALGLLMQAEAQHHQGHFPMVLVLIKGAQSKLVASFRPWSPKKTQSKRADAQLWAMDWLGKRALLHLGSRGWLEVQVVGRHLNLGWPSLHLEVLERGLGYPPGHLLYCTYGSRQSLKAIEGAGGKVEEENGTAD